jgi:protein gp37
MRKEWVEAIRDQCEETGVPFFSKQWGGVQKGKHGRTLDGRTYDNMPSLTAHPIPPEM